jgi:hypothetical protein
MEKFSGAKTLNLFSSQKMEENLHPPSFGQRRERGKRNEVRGKKIKIPLFSPHTSTLSPLVPLFRRSGDAGSGPA